MSLTLTAAETAKVLGVSESWVRRHKQQLPRVTMGGLLRFDSALISEHFRGKVAAGNSFEIGKDSNGAYPISTR